MNELMMIRFRCEICNRYTRMPQSTFDVKNFPKICCKCIKTQKPKQPYETRNIALKELGFNTYSEYLESSMWQTIREMVLKRDNHRCVLYKGYATEVHHQSYAVEVLIGKILRLLYSLCHNCHHTIEFDQDGNKRKLFTANKYLKRCLRKNQPPWEVTFNCK